MVKTHPPWGDRLRTGVRGTGYLHSASYAEPGPAQPFPSNQGLLDTASAPLEFLAKDAEERDLREDRQRENLFRTADRDHGTSIEKDWAPAIDRQVNGTIAFAWFDFDDRAVLHDYGAIREDVWTNRGDHEDP